MKARRILGWVSLACGACLAMAAVWSRVLVLLPAGVVFGTAGAILVVQAARSRGRKEWLAQYGRVVSTDFQAVESSPRIRGQDRQPYRIITRWRNPATGKYHTFRSPDLFYDPSVYCEGRGINVRIDPHNPSRYRMDTSFLPEEPVR